MLKAVDSVQQQVAINENNSNVNFRKAFSKVRNDMPANDTFEKEGKKDKKTGLVVGGILLGLAALVTGIALKKGLKLNKAKGPVADLHQLHFSWSTAAHSWWPPSWRMWA